MNHNQHPVRRNLTAVVAAAGLFAMAGCTSGNAAPKQTVTITRTVPAPTPSSEKGVVPATSEKLGTAEKTFQAAAVFAAQQIAEDATNPKSFTEAYGGTSVGNKRLELAKGLDKKAGFPEIFMSYDYNKTNRQASFTEVSIPTPGTTPDQTKFNSVTVTFVSTDPGLNNLDRKIAAAEQLTAGDYLDFISGSNISAREVSVINDGTISTEERMSLTLGQTDGTYNYSGPSAAAGGVNINDSNSELLDTVSRDMQSVAISLHQGLVS